MFVASDLMAAGALRALRRSGRRVPDDVAVIGFEDSPLAQHTEPKLTTVRQPVEAMGARLASELLALIGRGGPGALPRRPRHRASHARVRVTRAHPRLGYISRRGGAGTHCLHFMPQSAFDLRVFTSLRP